MQRYSMMKEIFVYIVGMKLKKQHYDKKYNNIYCNISCWKSMIVEELEDTYSGGL